MHDNAKRTVVTGATGFIGAHLTRALLERGCHVTALVRASSVRPLPLDVEDHPQLDVVDITDSDVERLAEHFGAVDTCFHLASLFLATHRPEDVARLVTSNVQFGSVLAESLRVAGCDRLVYAGTSWQHDTQGKDRPVNLYAATKSAFDAIVRWYCDATDLRACSLKLFDTWGLDDPRPKLFAALQAASARRETVALSPGDQLLDIVHVDDVVDAFIRADEWLESQQPGTWHDFGISSDDPRPLRDQVELWADALEIEADVEWGGRPYRDREVMVPWHVEPRRRLPNWRPIRSGRDLFQNARARI